MDPAAPTDDKNSALANRADGELLREFITLHREDAFAELVRRHGPMVMGVCRRLLGNRQDAEDAFQVTFLILGKNASSVRKPQMLGSWLFGVARRVSRKAQNASARRRAAHNRLINMLTNSRPDADPPVELLQFLDEEIDRLPAQYRAAIVTCYLEGKTNREAAKVLGWPEGTLVTRLNRAKEALRAKAASRGMTLSTAALGTALTQQFAQSAPLPTALIASTAKAASIHAVGKGVSAVLSVRAVSLLHDASRMIFLTKVKIISAVAAALIILGASAVVVTSKLGSQSGSGSSLVARDVDLKSEMPTLDEGANDAVLLAAVREARARAFGVARSGSGVAQDDGAFDDLGSDRPVSDRRGRVTFAFSSERFVTKLEFPADPGAGLGYAGDANRILAYRNLPPDPAVAQLIPPSGSTLDHKPVKWSVAEIARISPWPDDASFFEYLLHGFPQNVQWRIRRDGQVVRLLVINLNGGAFSERIGNSRMLVEFDMGHHAMTSLLRLEREAVSEEGAHFREIQRHQISWRSVGAEGEVPVERQVTLASLEGQTLRPRSTSIVRFNEYTLGPVGAGMLSPANLGIPDGTQVRDETDPSHKPKVWERGGLR